jgi:hypothetical protein
MCIFFRFRVMNFTKMTLNNIDIPPKIIDENRPDSFFWKRVQTYIQVKALQSTKLHLDWNTLKVYPNEYHLIPLMLDQYPTERFIIQLGANSHPNMIFRLNHPRIGVVIEYTDDDDDDDTMDSNRIVALLSKLPMIYSLMLGDTNHDTNIVATSIAHFMPSLERLIVRQLFVYNHGYMALTTLTNLRELSFNIDYNNEDDALPLEFFNAVRDNMPLLERLEVDHCNADSNIGGLCDGQLTDVVSQPSQHLKNLQYLDVSENTCDVHVVRNLARSFPRLRHLAMTLITRDGVDAIFNHCQSLESLYMGDHHDVAGLDHEYVVLTMGPRISRLKALCVGSISSSEVGVIAIHGTSIVDLFISNIQYDTDKQYIASVQSLINLPMLKRFDPGYFGFCSVDCQRDVILMLRERNLLTFWNELWSLEAHFKRYDVRLDVASNDDSDSMD